MNKKEAEPKIEAEQPIKRAMLKYGLGAFTAIELGMPFLISCSKNNRFLFLYNDFSLMNLPSNYVADNYAELTPKFTGNFPEIDLKSLNAKIMSVIATYLENLKLTSDNIESIVISEQVYGVAEDKSITQQAEDYCKRAVDYLYSQINGLPEISIKWTQVTDNNVDYSGEFNNRGYIANSFFEVWRYEVRFLEMVHWKDNFTIGVATHNKGGTAHISVKNNDSLSSWMFVLSANPSLLYSIYSEIIPILTYGAFTKKDNAEALIIGQETFSESLAYHLGVEMVRQLDIPKGLEHIANSRNAMMKSEIYSYVTQGIRYIRNVGVQEAYEQYKQNPNGFMRSVKNTK